MVPVALAAPFNRRGNDLAALAFRHVGYMDGIGRSDFALRRWGCVIGV